MNILNENSGKIALVTGGSRGIGLGSAIALAHTAAKVILVGRDEQKLIYESNSINSSGGDENIISLREICLTFNEDVEIKNVEKEGIDLGFLMNVTKAYKDLDWSPSVNFKTWANTLSVK